MKTINCSTCKNTLVMEGKSLDDQAEFFLATGWHEQYNRDGTLQFTCPKCLAAARHDFGLGADAASRK